MERLDQDGLLRLMLLIQTGIVFFKDNHAPRAAFQRMPGQQITGLGIDLQFGAGMEFNPDRLTGILPGYGVTPALKGNQTIQADVPEVGLGRDKGPLG